MLIPDHWTLIHTGELAEIAQHRFFSQRADDFHIMHREGGRTMYQNNHCFHMPMSDYGPEPFVTNIDKATRQNSNYRTALWTGEHLQLTLMNIPVGGEIGLEAHPDTDQFLRIESGNGMAIMGPDENLLNYQRPVCDGYSVFVPAGTWHNIINTGYCPLKIYTIYAPPHHPHGTVQATKAIADMEGY